MVIGVFIVLVDDGYIYTGLTMFIIHISFVMIIGIAIARKSGCLLQ